ncbi:hypothetical protein TNCV_3812961 [Trichonephila clavipes]|nr:hypothetical protein TNCV_3812961 [Trichonephila clavipes]
MLEKVIENGCPDWTTSEPATLGSLVVRASDSRPEDLVSMPPNTLRVHTEYVFVKSVGSMYFPPLQFKAEIVEVEIGGVPSISPSGNFAELNRTGTCLVLKVNDRRTSRPGMHN